MSLSEPFIRRPVGTTLLSLAIALGGMLAYFLLPVSPLPQVDFPTISVSAGLPGASPQTMASSVATPLERQLGHIAGVTEMTSSSGLGSANITLQFDLSRDINAAARDVQAAINASLANLPANLPGLPTWRKINPADAPIMILAITSDVYDRPRMFDAASSILAQKLAQLDGVGQVNVGGGALPAVRVEVNPYHLHSIGLDLEDVRTALGTVNVLMPTGAITSTIRTNSLATTDQLHGAAQYGPLIIHYTNNSPIRLSDIGRVIDSTEDTRTGGLSNGKPAVLCVIFRQPNANIISTVDEIKAMVPQLQASIPAGMHIQEAMDRTITIRASVHDVETTLLISVALVILVVFLFLRDPRSTLIPSVAVPISLIGTFGVMYLLGYSIDNLSLIALTIATGFVVDDAIVVIENIMRHIEAGMTPLAASLKGAQEIGFTVLSISLSLIAVFIPILMMNGFAGRLFREFAVTLSVAILVSLVVSLTTTPMMCAIFLRNEHERAHGPIYRASERIFDGILWLYEKMLAWVLRHSFLMAMLTVATILFTVLLIAVIPKGFFPQQDTGRISAQIKADQSTSSAAMLAIMDQYAKIVGDDPAIDGVLAFIGGGPGGSSSNTGSMFISLKDLDKRKLSADGVIARLRGKLSHIPGAALYMQAVQDIRVGARSSAAQYQYTLQSDNLDQLTNWSQKLMSKMKTIHGLADVTSDQQNSGLQVDLAINRDTASRLGLTASQIDNLLYDAFGQRQVSTTYTALNQYHVVMEIDPKFAQDPNALAEIYTHTSAGAAISLAAFASYKVDTTPISINHQGQFPAVTLSFNLLPGISLSDATDDIQKAKQEIGMPSTILGNFAGTASAYQDTLSSELWLVLAALVAVYIILGILYESLIHPITILSTLPSAGVGALVALMICRVEFSLIALIGIILLIGIVKKNAIMMIDFAIEEERAGKSPRDAIFNACLLRFRPITMTTLAAALGALPLAIGGGVGSEFRKPLGIAIVGGLIFSQALTLFTTPVIYLYMDTLRLWLRRRWQSIYHGNRTSPHPEPHHA
jgi:multidrug efflux pump